MPHCIFIGRPLDVVVMACCGGHAVALCSGHECKNLNVVNAGCGTLLPYSSGIVKFEGLVKSVRGLQSH
jgi:hypothetical protein